MEVNESILIEYIKGDLSPEEQQYVQKELNENEDLFQEYIKLKDIWDYAGLKIDALQYNKSEEWSHVEKATADKTKHFSIGLYIRVASVAASIILAFWLGNFWNKSLEDRQLVASHIFTAPEGQISELTLADGSVVILNAGSSLTIPSDFGSNNRNVDLIGEAHFDVAKNPELTFSVKSGEQYVKVLGTVFNIRAYPDEQKMITTLEEGLVRWEMEGQHIMLKPGMQVVYDVERNDVQQQAVDVDKVKQWSLGRYRYENASFEEIIAVIEKWHGVKVKWNPGDFKGQHFNGVLKRSATLNETFQLIEVMIPMDYSIRGQVVTIERMK